jgi:translation elongation factor P/translation initiation factor 5A
VGDVIVVNKEPMEVQKTEFTKFCCSGGILIHLWLKGLKSGRETLSTLKPDEPVEEHHGP